MMHPAIGTLNMGNGRVVYYAYVHGVYREGPLAHLEFLLSPANAEVVGTMLVFACVRGRV